MRTEAPEFSDWEDAAPDAAAMIESMRAYGYTLAMALADLIDNSIAAGAANVRLRFHWAGSQSWISITDDGQGMDENTLSAAMRLGSRNPLLERAPSDLGRFGLGLKTASFSQCRRLTVASKTANTSSATRRWDLDHLGDKRVSGWRLLKSAHPGSINQLRLPDGQDHGTVVLWEVLDRLVGDSEPGDAHVRDHFLSLVEETETLLAMVFHRYLARQRSGLRIQVNDNPLQAWDPFLEAHPATQKTPEEVVKLGTHAQPVRVQGFVLPHKDKLGAKDHKAAAGPAGWNAQQGFYLYRNERLIVAGSWLGLGPKQGWTQEEHYKLARIRIDLPNSMDHDWQLDVKKSVAQPPAAIRARLIKVAHSVRQDARRVFAHRGKHGTRNAKEEVLRPWKATTRAGALHYQIDRKHALIASVLAECKGDLRKRLEASLQVIEETVPVQQIWLDTSEKPDSFAGPFYGTGPEVLAKLIDVYYRTLTRVKGMSHDKALDLLLTSEEFADEEAQAIIQALLEEGDE